MIESKLGACPSSPNCVCSDDIDAMHRVAPLKIVGDMTVTWRELQAQLAADNSYKVVQHTDRYLRAEARTRIMRFVDDVEFEQRPDVGEIAMRSASRLGYSDFGANRRRLEKLRRSLAAAGVVHALVP